MSTRAFSKLLEQVHQVTTYRNEPIYLSSVVNSHPFFSKTGKTNEDSLMCGLRDAKGRDVAIFSKHVAALLEPVSLVTRTWFTVTISMVFTTAIVWWTRFLPFASFNHGEFNKAPLNMRILRIREMKNREVIISLWNTACSTWSYTPSHKYRTLKQVIGPVHLLM